MKKSRERMECLFHKYCCHGESFSGCAGCRDFAYSRDNWLRGHFERINGIIVPYNYDILFDPRVSRFAIVGDRS